MTPADTRDVPDWDALTPSVDFHDLASYSRGDEWRTYRLRVVSNGAELWRISSAPTRPTESIRETDCHDADQTATVLEEIRRALTAGGWIAE